MVRMGVVGYGLRGAGLITDVFRKLDPDVRVVGIVDQDEAGARGRLAECDAADVRFYKSLDDMVRKGRLDGLMIATRCNTHSPLAVKAARYDVPLYLEKPVAINTKQALALERAFENPRCKTVVSFPMRVCPICEFVKDLVAGGAVGEPQHVHAVNYVPYGTVYWELGYRNFEITQGLFLQKATHDFDYLGYVMGSPIVRVAAMANYGRVFGGKKRAGLVCSKCREQDRCLESPKNRSRLDPALRDDHLCLYSKDCGSPETGTNEDCSSALLEFASGAHGVYSQVFFARHEAASRGAIVSGYEGTVSFDLYTSEIKRVRHHSLLSDVTHASGSASHFGGDNVLARNFLDVIADGAESRTPIRIGIQSVYACLAAKKSAETGRFVDVRQVGI